MPRAADAPLVLDTHAWLWCTSDRSRLGRSGRRLLESARWIGVAAISCWEVAMLEARGRVSLDRPVGAWVEQALALPGVRLCPLWPEVSVAAAGLNELPGDPADRMIYATAAAEGALLLSKDERMTSYDRALPPAVRIVRW